MKTSAIESTSRDVRRTAKFLGKLVRDARLARRMPQRELADRARSSEQTLRRLEAGSPAVSMGAYLAAMEQVGLLPLLAALRDPASETLMEEHRLRRARLNTAKDMDF